MNNSKLIAMFVAILAALFSEPTARADFHVWTGAANGYWSNTNNWQNGSAPNLFESAPVYLEFPTGATRTAVTNDIYYGIFGPLYVDSIIVGNNYIIAGKGNGTNLVMTGKPAPFFGINLQNFYCTGNNIVFDQSLNITLLNTNTITNSVGSSLDMRSVLNGPGGWTFQGLGTMTLDGPNGNYFSGGCEVDSGTIILNRHDSSYAYQSISGPLVIGTTNTSVPAVVIESAISGQFIGFDTNDNGFYQSVTIMPSGTFRLIGAGGYNSSSYEIIGSLTMTGGTFSLEGLQQPGYNNIGLGTNFGCLWMPGRITVTASSYTSIITGHGMGWFGSNPGQKDTYDFQSASLILYATNTIDVGAGAYLLMDTPFTTEYTTGGGFGPLLYLPNTLIKTGGGTFWTTATNLYAGSTYIQDGVWAAGGNDPFGTTYNPTYADIYPYDYRIGPAKNQVVVSNGAQIIAVSGFSNAVPLVLNGFGFNQSGGALEALSDGARFTGGCTLGSESSVNVTQNATLTFDNFDNTNGDVAALAGSANFHKQGAGTLDLSMSLPAEYPNIAVLSGSCFVEQGNLTLAGQPNNLMIGGPLTIGTNGSTTVTTVYLAAPEQISSAWPMTINDNGDLQLEGYTQTVGPLALNGGSASFGSLILHGNVTAQTTLSGPEMAFISLSLGGTNRTFTVAANSTLTILGGIADGGNNAGIAKAGPGVLSLTGTGTYGGTTYVNAGILSLGSGDALGTTTAGTVVASGAEVDLAGGINVGAEQLTIAGTGVDGLGGLKSYGSNSWAGTVTLSSNTTVGVITNGSHVTSQLELSGIITGSGGLTEVGGGNLLLDGNQANSYAGTTLMLQGALTLSKNIGPAIPGALTIGIGFDGPNGDAVHALQNNQLSTNNTVFISSSGLLDLSSSPITSVGSVMGSGTLQLGGEAFACGYDNTSTSFSGAITGSAGGSVLKIGNGTFTLTGASPFAGIVQVAGGQLFVNGSLASAIASVTSSALLGGVGIVGPFGFTHGFLAPGTNSPGILNSGNVGLNTNDTLIIQINGTTPGIGYSQLNVTGTVSLGNAKLQLNMAGVGVTNSLLTIINNDGTDAVTGTFSGLAEGATLSVTNGAKFKISYHGGTGNDVVLTQTALPTPPSFTAITKNGNGDSMLNGVGVPNITYHLQANTNLTTTNWVSLGTVTATGLGALSFTDLQSTNFAIRFYRFVYP